MQMANQDRREDPMPQRTLEFRQAMKDFRTMFPTLESALIECVLRSNAGHVDSTIDQLLQLSQGPNGKPPTRVDWNANDDSTDSDDSIPSELLDPPTSSDDEIPVRDPPPMYTPRVGDPAPNFFGPNQPIEVPINDKKKSLHRHSKSNSHHSKTSKKSYRAWNPPMLGALPEDFLRILPQQFIDSSSSSREKTKLHKSSSGSRRRITPTSNSSHRNADSILSHREHSTRVEKYTPPLLNNPMTSTTPLNSRSLNNSESTEEDLTPPPRPPRTIQPRRLPQYGERDWTFHSDSIVPGNLSIRLASESRGLHQSMDPTLSNGQRQRHHHRSTRSSHGSRLHYNLPSSHPHQNLPGVGGAPISNPNGSNHSTRRSSDFSSRRMVMVSRGSEPSIPLSHNNGNHNGFHQSSLNNDRPSSSHRSYHRSSSHSFSSNHHHTPTSGHQSPVFQRGGSPAFLSSQSRSSGRPSSASSSRSRPRTAHEQEQYVEDQKLAILLQNEEFIRELKRNDDFLKALEKDRPNNILSTSTPNIETPDREVVPLPDPDAKYPHGSQNPSLLKRVGMDDPEKEEEKVFKENLKHMGKSARKKFNEIAKKFSVKRKTNYKAMKNIDPVFANCDDNFDEIPGPVPRSPVFDL